MVVFSPERELEDAAELASMGFGQIRNETTKVHNPRWNCHFVSRAIHPFHLRLTTPKTIKDRQPGQPFQQKKQEGPPAHGLESPPPAFGLGFRCLGLCVSHAAKKRAIFSTAPRSSS